MSDTILVPAGRLHFANAKEPVAPASLGAEFLGYEFLSAFKSRQEVLDLAHLRWPGGIPVEFGIDVTGDDVRDTVFDLRNPDLMDWRRFAGAADGEDGIPTGRPREGLSDMLALANAESMSFAMIAPTAPYVGVAIRTGDLAAAVADARADAAYFAERLARGEFGQVTDRFIVELGTEYYATDIWRNNNGIPGDNLDGTTFVSDYDLPDAFGRIFAGLALGLEEGLAAAGPDHGVDIEIAVQSARFQSANDAVVADGGPSDNAAFIRAFRDAGALDTIDSVVWHRYVPHFDGIAKGLWEPSASGYSLADSMRDWERAVGRDLDLIGGWLSPSAQPETDLEFGSCGLTAILQLYSGLIEAGMDVGTVFGLGLPASGALARGEDIFIGGQLYGLMAESLPGKFLHTGYQNNTPPALRGARVTDGTVNTFIYEGENEYAIFVIAKGLAGGTQTVTLEFADDILPARMTRLFEPGGVTDICPRVIGITGEIENSILRPVVRSGIDTLSFTFTEDFELVRLVVPKATPGIGPGTPGFTGTGLVLGVTSALPAPAGGDVIFGTPGDDRIDGGTGPDRLFGGAGDDILMGHAGNDVIRGDGGDDLIDGGIGADAIDGGTGNDRMFGKGGNDTIVGGGGDDVIQGNAGNDHLMGGAGADRLFGGQGRDILDGGIGPDVLWGQAGDDILVGKAGEDRLIGGPGNDRLEGGAGFDRLFGGQGADRLDGGLGPDVLWGQAGPDLLLGRAGADSLFGGPGDDVLQGGPGDDLLHGGPGNDRMRGDAGADTFVFFKGDGQDAILDMGPADTILLQGSALGIPTAAALNRRIEDIPGGYSLDFGGGDSLTILMRAGSGPLTASDFLLV
jgi:Ca2+-binding RTX toxin-like protein